MVSRSSSQGAGRRLPGSLLLVLEALKAAFMPGWSQRRWATLFSPLSL